MNNRILQNSYNKSALNYDNQLAHIQMDKYRTMLKDFRWQRHNRILDLGCGTALLHGFLASTFDSQPHQEQTFDYYGIDFSAKMIQLAQAKHQSNTHLTTSNFVNLPYSDHFFDYVFSFTAIGLSDDPIPQIFTQCHRVIKPTGALVFTVLKHFDPLIIKKHLLETGFRLRGTPLCCGQDIGFHCVKS